MKKLSWIHWFLTALLALFMIVISQGELIQCKCTFGHASAIARWRETLIVFEVGAIGSFCALIVSASGLNRTGRRRWHNALVWSILLTTPFALGVAVSQLMIKDYERAQVERYPTRIYLNQDKKPVSHVNY